MEKENWEKTRFNLLSLPVGFLISFIVALIIYLSLDKSSGPQMGPEAGFVTKEGIVGMFALFVGTILVVIFLLIWLVRIVMQIFNSKSSAFRKANIFIICFYWLLIFFCICGKYIYQTIVYEVRESRVIDAQYEAILQDELKGHIVAAYASQDTLYLLTLSSPVDHDQRDAYILEYPELVRGCKAERQFRSERNLRFYSFYEETFTEIPGLNSPMIDSVYFMNSHEFFLKYSHSGFERKRLKRIENPDTTKVKVIHLKAPNCDKVRIVGSTHQHPAHLTSANNKTLVDLNGYYTRRWLSGTDHRYMIASEPSEAVNILAPTFHDEFDENRNDHYIYIADAEVDDQTIYKLKLDSIPQIKVCAKVDNKLYLFQNLEDPKVLRVRANNEQ